VDNFVCETQAIASTHEDSLANGAVIGGGFEVAGIVIETTDDIVQVIERERVRQGLSQRQLCAEAGLSHGAYWFVKQNRGGLHMDTALRLLEAVGAGVSVEVQK
jgi:hypothetical protein